MEKETLPREKVMNLESDRDEEQEFMLMKTGHMLESLGRNLQETMKEVEDDEGWERVRERKKRPNKAGAPNTGQTRPGSQRFKTRQNMVSSTHWRALNPAGDQVSPPDLLPKMGDILNSKFCPQPESGPLTPSEKAILQNDIPSPPIEPLEVPKSSDIITSEPTGSGSSAGHTPFPNRLASMARDLRRRQIGISSLSLSILGPKCVGDPAAGSKRPDIMGSITTSPKTGYSRNEKVLGLGLTESGTTDQVTARVEDIENLKTDNAKEEYMKMQGGHDLGGRGTNQQNSPDIAKKENEMGNAEKYDLNMANKRRSREG